MADTTTARALALLDLLQSHRHWSGVELAGRLGVTQRTVRRDVERLRGLGYRIDSLPGVGGGYRLEAGAAMPPLLLTEQEAAAMAIGLRVAGASGLADGEQTAITALAKLEQVLPAPARRRVAALAASVSTTQPWGQYRTQAMPVDPGALGELAILCRDRERMRFDYVTADGAASHRRADPHSLVNSADRWFLVAWDLDREDWRTFRVDRITRVEGVRVTAPPRALPVEDAAQLLEVSVAALFAHHETSLILDASPDRVREVFGRWAEEAEPAGDGRTRWRIWSASAVQESMHAIAWIPTGMEFTVEDDEALRAYLHELGARMQRA